jgi:hypothetical protein
MDLKEIYWECVDWIHLTRDRNQFLSLVARGRWEDNIKMDLNEVGWDGVDWFHVA